MEHNDIALIIMFVTLSFAIGVPLITLSFFIIRRLHELHKARRKIDGELFVSDTGEIFSEFYIPIDELTKRNDILLKVTKVNPKTKGGNNDGNVSTEIYKT